MLQINVTIFVEICNIKNAKVVQGSRLDRMVAVAFLVLQEQQIGEITLSLSLPAGNLGKEINIKIIQRNYDGIYRNN